jgi:hypothetical protein
MNMLESALVYISLQFALQLFVLVTADGHWTSMYCMSMHSIASQMKILTNKGKIGLMSE